MMRAEFKVHSTRAVFHLSSAETEMLAMTGILRKHEHAALLKDCIQKHSQASMLLLELIDSLRDREAGLGSIPTTDSKGEHE